MKWLILVLLFFSTTPSRAKTFALIRAGKDSHHLIAVIIVEVIDSQSQIPLRHSRVKLKENIFNQGDNATRITLNASPSGRAGFFIYASGVIALLPNMKIEITNEGYHPQGIIVTQSAIRNSKKRNFLDFPNFQTNWALKNPSPNILWREINSGRYRVVRKKRNRGYSRLEDIYSSGIGVIYLKVKLKRIEKKVIYSNPNKFNNKITKEKDEPNRDNQIKRIYISPSRKEYDPVKDKYSLNNQLKDFLDAGTEQKNYALFAFLIILGMFLIFFFVFQMPKDKEPQTLNLERSETEIKELEIEKLKEEIELIKKQKAKLDSE